MTSFLGETEEQPTFYEGAVYWERPFVPETSIVATSWSASDPRTPTLTRHEIAVGLKRAVIEHEGWTLAAQGSAVWISDTAQDCDEGGGELRVLAGRGFGEDGLFFNVEAAAREFGGGCGSRRLDLTAGFRPSENWLALGQVFYDAPHEGDEVIRAQVSLVRFNDSGRGIQVGVRSRIDGNAQETAVVVGLWNWFVG